MAPAILTGYFARHEDALEALRGLSGQGFRRVALIRKDKAGDVRVTDPFRRRRVLGTLLAAALSGGIAAVGFSAALLPACAAAGTLAALMWFRWAVHGVDREVLRRHSRWLVPGETVLVLQAPVETLQRPVALLRETGEIPPALFVMHPGRERRTESRGGRGRLSLAQVREHAQRHALEQRVSPVSTHGDELLERLRQSRRWIRRVCADLAAASRLEQKATPAADWILDNEYVLDGNARDVLLNLPRKFYRQLPSLADGQWKGLPCIYGLAKDLVAHTELRLDRENILAFIEAHQSVRALTIGELWAIPQMLRIALIESIRNLAVTALADLRERQLADFWANRLIAANRRDPNRLFAMLAELASAEPSPSAFFGAQLVGLLYDEAAVQAPIRSWLERTLKTGVQELNLREQLRETREQMACGDAFTSLRQLALLDWRELFEKISRVEQALRRDPAGVHARTDFQTRDGCRRAVEELARDAGLDEVAVAERVVALAAKARPEPDGDARRGHVGAWLAGEGRAELARLLGCRAPPRDRLLEWTRRRHTAVYSLGVGGFSAVLVVLIAAFALAPAPGEGAPSAARCIGLALLLLVPASQLAVEAVNYLLTRFLPPRPLPKMDFSDSGIPDAFRTLVVVPMMLSGGDTVRAEAEKLEIRYLGNKEDNLLFSLFTDYTDSPTLSRDDDAALLRIAVERIEALNRRHGGDRFYLFHRERVWSDSEQRFIGWERKRGKLEELNRLIDGTRAEGAGRLVHVGDPDRLADVRFVITLDSDTQLPHDAARRLVETLAHPLNQPRFDAEGRVVPGTYTIIQPRVSPTLPSTSASTFSRLFSDAVGIDPYTQAVSDVYQDLSGEGSYHGKGIYDVRAFSRVLSGRFPEGWVLSHDLIEGAHVRVGLASDIELYDEFPQGYQGYSSRAHRWTRGDWQIAGWIGPRVPLPGGGRGPNPLSLFDRWKIVDNLRRSLLPAASLAILPASWLVSPKLGGIAALVVGAQLLFHPLSQPFTMATTRRGLRFFSPSKLLHDLARATADAALLPHQAGVALDAIARVGYRRLVSRRNLLEWTAQATHWSATRRQPLFVATLAIGSLFSAAAALAILRVRPGSLPAAAPWLVLWFLSPLLGWLLNRRPVEREAASPLPEEALRFLRQVARRTWRYFSTYVTAETSWLPPDNVQPSRREPVAMRTSPTNIGLWMAGALGAHDSGYLTLDQVVDRLADTLSTLGRLERHEGHLLNWYDIGTLAPLEPRYVSTVDSGNLLGALWALEQGLGELAHAPLLDDKAFAGLADTLDLLPTRRDDDPLRAALDAPPAGLVDRLALLRRARAEAGPAGAAGASPWADELDSQLSAWERSCDSYLGWIGILAEMPDGELVPLGEAARAAIRIDLARAPSLAGLARGRFESVATLRTIRGAASGAAAPLLPWIDRVLEAFARAQWLAGETLGRLERLAVGLGDLSAGMNMRFLYDPKRKLFAIGYNVSAGRLDVSSYDLLASEARLGSFVAIARGDVPMAHWFSLGRPYGAIGRQRVLLSWTGTMFEYLMPLLFQRAYRHSLLDKAAREAVAVQIAYGRMRRVPWGISESAYADLDQGLSYQYKAFGVAPLGLKRGLEEQLVVAPYAALLALAVAPAETVRNLKAMAALGLVGEYGCYESMDFSRQPQREGKRGVIVEAFMAHHQGMAFLSLVNFLRGDPFPRRFHADPRVRAFEALLQERIPALPPLHLISTRPAEALPAGGEPVAPAGIAFDTPHTVTPRVLLLGNGRYGLMVTNAGGGCSRWGGVELTRWRSDPTCDAHGTFCYVHDADSDRVWSTAWQPVGGAVEGYSVDFAPDRAVFRRSDGGIHTETEIVVSPEDDVEVRRITLANRSARPRRLDLTSCVELSMAPHDADRQHPAFNKLFIETEALPGAQALLAGRRPRDGGEAPLYVGHVLAPLHEAEEAPSGSDWQFETDRGRFIGRGRTPANPMGASRDLGNSQGFVLDPMLGIRRSVTLAPGGRVRYALVLAAGATREAVLLLLDKYGDPHATERAMDFAWRSTQQQLQMLRIQPDEARRFQQLASHLLYPGRLLRAPAERLEENRKGQAGLWPYAISGDLPIVLVTIGEGRDIGLVRQMLQAHAFWRMRGLAADLVVLNEEAGGYERPLHERLDRMIKAHVLSAPAERPGEIFLKRAADIPEDDLKLLKAAAAVVLVAARGTLPQQLGQPVETPEPPSALPRKRMPREPSAPLPFMELAYFNSLGGFTRDGREYAIYLGPDTHTPAPWVNVIANPAFGTMVSETGAGFTWSGNSQRNRLTGWSNDPVLDPASEALYLRDEESGAFWSPTASPIREESAYRARHGAGYTVFEHNSHGIEQELTVFVPVDADGGKPVKLQRLRLTNASPRRRSLSVTFYAEWTLGEHRERSQMHVATCWDDESGALLARNRYHPDCGERVAFAAVTPRADSHGGDRAAFIGRNRTLADPAALSLTRLSNRTGAGLDPCAALRVAVELAPGEQRDVVCMLGQAGSDAEARALVLGFREDRAFEDAFDGTRAWWDGLLGAIEVRTPEPATDLMVNRWLQYQSLSCRIWGRSAFYQSGGAFGFRDQLQDVMAFLHASPGLAREQILLSAGRQFREGDVQHWWHPPGGAGIRSRISDDLLWLPHVVIRYVRTTGDLDILSAEIPFLDAPPLSPDQHERFSTPAISADRAPLLEHCRRAVARGLTIGPRGLPLMGTGDWNDGMNRVGAGGKGESVWLGWFLCDLLDGMAWLSDRLGQAAPAEGYRADRLALARRIEAAGWDGEWYLRGTFDDGSPLGSAGNREGRIDSLPQSWAWLSGAAEPARADRAIESAWRELVKEDEGLALLFTPPFDRSEPSPGYIQGYPPGVRENGGQYTHAAIWMAMAMARKGDGERAVRLLRMLNPIEHARDAESAWRYGIEPYVVAADVYRLPGRVGHGGWSWYTGSASWMYRAWVEEVLGLHVDGEAMRLDPVIPAGWPGFSLRYRHGEAVYEVRVENPDGRGRGVAWVEMDGRRLDGGLVPLERNPVIHRVVVRMGPA